MDTSTTTESPPEAADDPTDRDRRRKPHGLLMRRAIDLRNELPDRPKRQIPARRAPWAIGAIAGLVLGVVGINLMGSDRFPSASLAVVLSAVGWTLIGIAGGVLVDERTFTRLAVAIRRVVYCLLWLVGALTILLALGGVVLIGLAARGGSESSDSNTALGLTIVFGLYGVASGCFMMSLQLPVVILAPPVGLRSIMLATSVAATASTVVAIGAGIAYCVGDVRAAIPIMFAISLAVASWTRSRHGEVQDALRAMATAADDVFTNAYRLMRMNTSDNDRHALLTALSALDLACVRRFASLVGMPPKMLVEAELVYTVQAVMITEFQRPNSEQPAVNPLVIVGPLTRKVLAELEQLDQDELLPHVVEFAADVKRLLVPGASRFDFLDCSPKVDRHGTARGA